MPYNFWHKATIEEIAQHYYNQGVRMPDFTEDEYNERDFLDLVRRRNALMVEEQDLENKRQATLTTLRHLDGMQSDARNKIQELEILIYSRSMVI
jgi:multidrug efflux pump subunit AcrA (membrane-fusion protein)